MELMSFKLSLYSVLSTKTAANSKLIIGIERDLIGAIFLELPF